MLDHVPQYILLTYLFIHVYLIFVFLFLKKCCHGAIDICRTCMIDQFSIPFAPICTEREKKNLKSNMDQFKDIRPIKCLSKTMSMVIDLTKIGRSWMMTKKLYFILSFKIEIILGGPRCWLSAVYQSEEKTRLLFHSWNISLTHDFCSILLPIISDTSYILAIKQTFHRTKQEEIYSGD